MTTYTASGTMDGQPLDALADITTNSGTLAVDLSNLEANPTSASQEISGIQITFANPVSNLGTLTQSGSLINIGSGGRVIPVSGSPDWTATESDNTVTLTTLTHAQPNDLIIGPPGGSGVYSAANNSIIHTVSRENFDNWAEHEELLPESRATGEIEYPRAQSARQVPPSRKSIARRTAGSFGQGHTLRSLTIGHARKNSITELVHEREVSFGKTCRIGRWNWRTLTGYSMSNEHSSGNCHHGEPKPTARTLRSGSRRRNEPPCPSGLTNSR